MCIESPSALVVRDLEVKAGILGVPEGATQALARTLNPLIDFRSANGLPLELELRGVETQEDGIELEAAVSFGEDDARLAAQA